MSDIILLSHGDGGVFISEEKIPIKKEVKGTADMLGLDPLYLANEGKFVAVVREDQAEEFVQFLIIMEFPLPGRKGKLTQVFPGIVF